MKLQVTSASFFVLTSFLVAVQGRSSIKHAGPDVGSAEKGKPEIKNLKPMVEARSALPKTAEVPNNSGSKPAELVQPMSNNYPELESSAQSIPAKKEFNYGNEVATAQPVETNPEPMPQLATKKTRKSKSERLPRSFHAHHPQDGVVFETFPPPQGVVKKEFFEAPVLRPAVRNSIGVPAYETYGPGLSAYETYGPGLSAFETYVPAVPAFETYAPAVPRFASSVPVPGIVSAARPPQIIIQEACPPPVAIADQPPIIVEQPAPVPFVFGQTKPIRLAHHSRPFHIEHFETPVIIDHFQKPIVVNHKQTPVIVDHFEAPEIVEDQLPGPVLQPCDGVPGPVLSPTPVETVEFVAPVGPLGYIDTLQSHLPPHLSAAPSPVFYETFPPHAAHVVEEVVTSAHHVV